MRPRILKNNLILSEFQKEVLIGLLLGDGCLERSKNSSGARLKVSQGGIQHEFVEWLYEVFKDFVQTPPRIKQTHRNGKNHYEVVFNTLTHPDFKNFHEMFYSKKSSAYPQGKKIIPESINKFLTQTAFAVWFMGDGSIKSKECKGRILNTQSFNREEIDRLILILKDKFDLKSSIRTQKDGLQIYISAKSAETLNYLLKDKILPSFNYKLPIKS